MVRVEEVSPRPDVCLLLVEIRMLFLNQDIEGRGDPAAEQERIAGLEEERKVMMEGGEVVMETWLLGCWLVFSRPGNSIVYWIANKESL